MTVHVTSHVASLSRNNVLHMNHFISEKWKKDLLGL
jgi:hypothetical protein